MKKKNYHLKFPRKLDICYFDCCGRQKIKIKQIMKYWRVCNKENIVRKILAAQNLSFKMSIIDGDWSNYGKKIHFFLYIFLKEMEYWHRTGLFIWMSSGEWAAVHHRYELFTLCATKTIAQLNCEIYKAMQCHASNHLNYYIQLFDAFCLFSREKKSESMSAEKRCTFNK